MSIDYELLVDAGSLVSGMEIMVKFFNLFVGTV